MVHSFRNKVADRAVTVSDEVRLRLAVAIVERKTKSIIETSTKLLAGAASQQQIQTMVDAADRVRMRTAQRIDVSASAIGARCESLTLLRALAAAKPRPDTIVVPIVVAHR